MRAFDAHIFVHPFSSSLIKERERRRRRITRYKQDEEADTRRLATRPSDHQEQEQGTRKELRPSALAGTKTECGRGSRHGSTTYLSLASAYRLESGLGPLGTSCLPSRSPCPAEFHLPRGRGRHAAAAYAAAGRGRSRRPHGEDAAGSSSVSSLSSPCCRAAGASSTSTAQRKAHSRSRARRSGGGAAARGPAVAAH